MLSTINSSAMMKPPGRRRLFSPLIAKCMYMLLSWVLPVKLLSSFSRFLFQSQTTRAFMYVYPVQITYSLWLPRANYMLCLLRARKMHNVPSIAKRAPGNRECIMLLFMHTYWSFGGKQITGSVQLLFDNQLCIKNELVSTPSISASVISVPSLDK